jgi:formylglycine-generating enzyme
MKTKLGPMLLMLLIAVGCDDSTQNEQPAEQPAESFTKTMGMNFSLIPAGTFTMGSPTDEVGRYSSETQHKITISKGFYMQTTEVTQSQWNAVMGSEPWKGQISEGGPNYPAMYVSWNDAVAYCEKLSEKEGKTYRLPTEAEWEYACRAKTHTAWSFGNDEKELGNYGWYHKNTNGPYDPQVGSKKPNAFGLYDMHGNVMEWCSDYYEEDYYLQSPATDPQGPTTGSIHVLRGGAWINDANETRSANRNFVGADVRVSSLVGFRIVQEVN